MTLALGPDGTTRIRAERTGERATCPGCKSELMAKCGEHVAKHWSHYSAPDCDPWYEGMSEWHAAWQELFPDGWLEVQMPPHRADVRTPTGLVLEIQHSPIGREAADREAFYGNMAWIVDASGWQITWDRPDTLDDGYVGFHFVTRKPSLRAFKKPTFLDFGPSHNLFRILWPNSRFPIEAWSGVGVRGEIVDRSAFVRVLQADEPIPERPLYEWHFFDSKLRAEAKRKKDEISEIRRAAAEARRIVAERLAREQAQLQKNVMHVIPQTTYAYTPQYVLTAPEPASRPIVPVQKPIPPMPKWPSCPIRDFHLMGDFTTTTDGFMTCSRHQIEGDRADRAEIGQ